MIATLVLTVGMCSLGQGTPAPQLTDEQLARVRNLLKSHQDEQPRLKAELDKAQQKLAALYSSYQLDEAAVTKAQQEVLNAQQKLLQSYHTMQKELRSIIGPERFQIMSRRIEQALKNPPESKKK
jgi:Spy/CpxP family protein refolding chaperone